MIVSLVTAALLSAPPASADALTLEDCIRIANERSPMVAAARYGVEAIDAQYREVWWSQWFPTIKLRTLATVIPPQGDSDPDSGPDLSGWNFWSRTDLEAHLPLYTFGKLSAGLRMAEHGVDAMNAVLAETRNELTYRVKQAWYTVQLTRALQELVDDAESELKSAREKLERMEFEDDPDYDQADGFRLRIYEAEIRKLVLDNERVGALAKSGLREALTLPAGTPLNLVDEGELEPVQVDLASLDTILERAARSRPELMAQRKRVDVARANVDLRWGEFFPDIFLAGSFTVAASTVDNRSAESVFEGAVFNAVGGGAALGLQLTLDYPQKIARYHRAKAELSKAQAEVRAREQLLRLRLDEVWREAKAHREMLALRKRAMKASKSLLTLKAHEYENGLDGAASFEDVLNASATYLKQKAEWLRAIHSFNLSAARLSREVGAEITKETTKP